MSDAAPRPRRFYTDVRVAPEAGGFAVRLDGRSPRSPAGAPLAAPAAALAEAIAGEWRDQREEIDLSAMPLTRLAYTALDRGAPARDALAGEVARYAGSDALIYFADDQPTLAAEQAQAWGPWLDWARDALGVRLARAEGIMPRPQPAQSLARARALALEADDFALTGLAYAAALFGSAVLAFALARGALEADAAHDLARLEQAFQERRWGEDAEAAARTAGRLEEARAAGRWFAALRAG